MKWSFEELEVWKKSFLLWKELGQIFYHTWFKNYSFQDQIMRSTLSISNNIAEWNDRWSNKDFVKFLFIAKASAAETKNMIYFAYEFGYIDNTQKQYYIDKLSTIMNQLWKFIQYLKTHQT